MSIGVYARIRPEAEDDGDADERLSVLRSGEAGMETKGVLVRNLEFQLDWVFDEAASQEAVYDIVGRDRVARILSGYNVAILAYGQTGSGKTHTMFGPESVLTDWRAAAPELHGLALRAVSDLFAAVEGSGGRWQVACSFMEIYCDQCNDLLGGRRALPLREGPNGMSVEGLALEEAASVPAAMEALARGSARRTVAQMRMNLRSSRSHAVFSLSVTGGEAGGGEVTSGKLVLVDLAGMESSKKSYSVEGESSKPQRREEAKHINTSLYALGTVIERLCEDARQQQQQQRAGGGRRRGSVSHVPFRNSKLTRLLQECLVGNVASAFVVTLRGESAQLDECAATLRFAQRAAAVPVVVRANVQAAPLDPAKLGEELKAVTKELSEARGLIERLQRERAQAADRDGGGSASASEAADAREDDMALARLQIGQLAEQFSDLVEQTRDVTSQPPVAAAPPPPEEDYDDDDGADGAALAAIDAELAAIEAYERAQRSGADPQKIAQLHAFACFARQQTTALEEALQSLQLYDVPLPSKPAGAAAAPPPAPADRFDFRSVDSIRSGSSSNRPASARTAAALEASAREQQALLDLQGLGFASSPGGGRFTLAPSELRAVLERCDWDVNAAACELMDLGL